MTTTRHGSWFTLVVLFMTWNGGYAASNLDCCNGELGTYAPFLNCWTACSFRRIPAPLPTNLTTLWIERQDIADIKVGDFPRHEVLKRLYIRNSNVVVLQPGAFGNLPSITTLDLRSNKIRRLEADTFKGLVWLVDLDLEDNEIHHIDRKAFVGLVRLRRLGLGWNCLSSIPQGTPSTTSIKLTLELMGNPITSIPDVDELRHIGGLDLLITKFTELQCDCKLREVKRWRLENAHLRSWYIGCKVNATVAYVRFVDWEDLRCASPDVSVTLDTRAATGNASFTCRTDCQEGLTFAWITPSGDYRPPSYEYSKNYTHVSNSSCKGSPLTRLETRRMCYSVLNVPGAGGDVEGTYTCVVTADHTDNASASAVLTVSSGTTEKSTTRAYSPEPQTTVRVVTPPDRGVEEETANRPDVELSTTQLVLVGLGSFCGCTVIVVVVAACGSWCHGKQARQADRANGGRDAEDGHNGTDNTGDARGGHYENDDRFSDTNGDSRAHYENDDQFSDTAGATGGHYENDDQVSDTNGDSGRHYENDDELSDTGGHYENDDQFSDANGDSGGHYENDDEFSDTEGAKGGHYENEDQFSDTEGTRETHYENDDQFSDEDASRNSHKSAPGQLASRAPGKTPSAARAKRNRRRHKKRDLVKTRATSNNKTTAAVSSIVAFHAEAQAGGHYDNESKGGGRNLSDSNARTASDNGACGDKELTDGHYDNDKTAKGSASKTDDDSDSSDHDYMSLPENRVAGREVGHEEDNDPVSTSASATEVSENEYVTLPGTENDGENSDHTYMTLPSADHTHNVTLPETKNEHDNTYGTVPMTENTGENSDHTYNLTLPDIEKPTEQQIKREEEDRQASADSVSALPDSNDTDHVYMVYVTVPDNADEQQSETDEEEKNKRLT